MLLAIDMGNTQTAMGLFDGDELVQSWRMPTDRSYTADEIHVRLMGFFKMYGLSLDAVDAIAFAGVVPQLSREWHAVADRIAADAIVICLLCSCKYKCIITHCFRNSLYCFQF